ncbi:MAG: aldehyde ferredoxin oxidoreductase C-terminal domain-containing protein [Promethearchaeota archaeon]
MKIIRVNLKKGSTYSEEITKESKFFLLGGRALSAQILSNEVPPECDPLGAMNKLIIAIGTLAGTPFPNSARTSVGGKSPLTNGIKEANVGGRPGMMLAMRGIRALVFENISAELKLVLINDEGIQLLSASEYENLGNYDLHQQLYTRYGEKIGIYSIGPAGEHMLCASTVAANDLEGYPSRHAARGGLGAVMGSKKVKAVIITPPKMNVVKIHDIQKFRETSKPFARTLALTKETFSIFGTPLMMKAMSNHGGLPTKNFRMGSYDDVDKISGELLHELTVKRGGKKRLPCSPTCTIKCSNLIIDDDGSHITSSLEYETIFANGSNCMINNIDKIAHIDYMCDDMGIDTIEFGVTMAVAMDAGKIEWGDADKVLDILKNIRENDTIRELYGNGVVHLGKELNFSRIPQVKGQGISGYDPRVFKAMGVTYATSPMGADHTAGAAIAGRAARQNRDYGDLTRDEGKLQLSYELQVYTAVLDSMGCCYFIGPNYETMEIVANALNAMYDLNIARDDIIKLGKKILKTELEFNEKAGILSGTNDLPDFFRKEPSDPVGLKVSFTKDEFRDFWNRLSE